VGAGWILRSVIGIKRRQLTTNGRGGRRNQYHGRKAVWEGFLHVLVGFMFLFAGWFALFSASSHA